MIDRSLLSRLPPRDLIRLALLKPHEAAAHFRVAAKLCLDGARCVAFRDLEQERLCHRLIADGVALYTLAFQRLSYPSTRAIRTPSIWPAANDPVHGSTPNEKPFLEDIIKGMHCAEHWLEHSGPLPLSKRLSQARQNLPTSDRQHAFETGFLFRLQEHLLTYTIRQ